jgi:hypothetical protein
MCSGVRQLGSVCDTGGVQVCRHSDWYSLLINARQLSIDLSDGLLRYVRRYVMDIVCYEGQWGMYICQKLCSDV